MLIGRVHVSQIRRLKGGIDCVVGWNNVREWSSTRRATVSHVTGIGRCIFFDWYVGLGHDSVGHTKEEPRTIKQGELVHLSDVNRLL